jgi:flavin-dependent dehydrogenase
MQGRRKRVPKNQPDGAELAEMFASGGGSAHVGSLQLSDGDHIAVVGGGPAGAAFAIFFLSLARELGRDISLTVFERKDFSRAGPVACNQCAGVISESLLAMLCLEGVRLSEPVVQHGVDSYRFVTPGCEATLSTKSDQRAIATVYRAGGPLKGGGARQASFDSYILSVAASRGAKIEDIAVDSVEADEGGFAILSQGRKVCHADLLVGAFGHRSSTAQVFEGLGSGYKRPATLRVMQVEIPIPQDEAERSFGSSVVVTLRPVKGVGFCALTPKSDGVTMTLLGKKLDPDTPAKVISVPHIRRLFGQNLTPEMITCRCVPLLTLTPAKNYFGDRMVVVGDACVSKLLKDGIGSAFITARAAANCALLFGISKEAFRRHYQPTCSAIARDNRYGALLLFYLAPWIGRIPGLSKIVAGLVNQERLRNREELTGILWDTFTGTNPYAAIVRRSMSPRLWMRSLFTGLRLILGRGGCGKGAEEVSRMGGAQLGRRFGAGEEIVKQGDIGDEMYVILSGAAEVFVDSEGGRKKMADLAVGDFFGEMALFDRDVRSATVVAREETRVLSVDKAALLARIAQNPTLGLRIIEKMSRRIRQLNEAVASSASEPAKQEPG